MKYDVIIPMAFNELMFIDKALPYIEQNLIGVDTIYLITNKKYFKKLSKLICKHQRCVVLDENELVPEMTFLNVSTSLNNKYGKGIRTGWYFQQFIKMGFAHSSYCKDYYLSWDADTIPLRPIFFFDKDNRPIFTMKSEYNKPYFDTMERLLGLGKIAEGSFIAEHMMFKKNIMKEIITEIEKRNSRPWYDAIIFSTDYASAGRPEMFSEFETYGTYCLNKYPNVYVSRTLSSFREAGFIRGRFLVKRILQRMSFDLDTASFELQHCPAFPWSVIHKFYKLYLKYVKYLYI